MSDWLDTLHDWVVQSQCPGLLFMHLAMWAALMWLLIWPGTGHAKPDTGPAGNLWHWRGVILRLIDRAFPVKRE